MLIRMGSPILKKSGGHVRHFSPPFALKYIESLLQGSFQVKLIDCLVVAHPLKKLLSLFNDYRPEVVIFCSSIHTEKATKRFANFVKNKYKSFLIAIGQGPTSEPSAYNFPGSPFDAVVTGEAEEEVCRLVEKLKRGVAPEEIRKIYQDKLSNSCINLIADLDALPFPTYSLSEIKAYRFFYPIALAKRLKWGHILSSRGCTRECLYCSQVTRESYGDTVRLRSPANVVDEIEKLMSKGVNIVSFDDDNFTTSREHVKGVCNEILQRGLEIKWIVHARIDELDFPKLVMMKNAGCVLLRLGVESGSRRIIEILGKSRQDLDWIRISSSTFNYARKVGIATDALFMIGNPTETEEEVEETLKLAQMLEPDFIQVHFFTIYPGSAVYEHYKKEIARKELPKMYHYCMPRFNPSNIAINKLLSARVHFYRSFFLRPKFLMNHFLKYGIFYFHNIDVGYRLSKIWKMLFYE